MREIKFRQRNKNNGHWHFWGLINGVWVNPLQQDNYVRPEESDQSTGLHDKNGKDVFEGDVTNNGIIRFGKENEGIGFYLEELEWCERGEKRHHDTHTLFAFTTPFEVIGNIYEDGDLLTNQ